MISKETTELPLARKVPVGQNFLLVDRVRHACAHFSMASHEAVVFGSKTGPHPAYARHQVEDAKVHLPLCPVS